jgi:hypothetical protein
VKFLSERKELAGKVAELAEPVRHTRHSLIDVEHQCCRDVSCTHTRALHVASAVLDVAGEEDAGRHWVVGRRGWWRRRRWW